MRPRITAHGGAYRAGRPQLAPVLPVLVDQPRGPGPLRGDPQDRPGDGRAGRGGRRDPGSRRAVPGVHARPAAPGLPQWPRRADRGPLGADDRRHPLGGVVHRDRRPGRGRDVLGPRRGRRAVLRRVRRSRHARVLHPRALPQARGRRDRRPPARRALRALGRGGDRRARGGRARSAHHHLARRGGAAARRDRRRQALTRNAPLLALVGVVGAATLVAEIAAARLLAPYFGSSTFIWANTIAVVLLALSVGYWWGGRMADRRASERDLRFVVLVAAALLAAVPF